MKKGMKSWLAPATAGMLAGLANGFFGGGGGMLLVPMLTRYCGLDQRRAFATSVAVILPLCGLSAAIYWMRGGREVGPVSYTHLDVYKRQPKKRMKREEDLRWRRLLDTIN